MGLRPRARFARVELRYDLLLKPRNVHVDFTVIIHCNSFLIDQFVWKISYVNIFPNWFRWKVGWIIVAFLIIWEEILIWKPVFASANSFTITADEFQDSMIVNFSESQIRKDAEITTFKFFSDVLTSIDAGGILICSLKKKSLGIRSCYSTKESSFHDIPWGGHEFLVFISYQLKKLSYPLIIPHGYDKKFSHQGLWDRRLISFPTHIYTHTYM